MLTLHRTPGLLLILLCTTAFSFVSGNARTEETELADSRGKLEGETYSFHGTPAFRIQVPTGCKLGKRSDPNAQVVSLRTPEDVTVEASVAAVDEDFRVSNGGLVYFNVLRRVIGKNHELLEHKKINLARGVTGYRTDMIWTIDQYRIHTILVSAVAEGHWVFIAVHPTKDIERFARIVQSLTLEK